MFGFLCSHCGKIEMLHSEDISSYLQSGQWPDKEYGEDVDIYDIKEIFTRVRGYKYSLKKCPGFEKHSNVTNEMMILAAMDHPLSIPYAEEDIGDEASRRLEEESLEPSGSHLMYEGCMTYIARFPDGISRVFIR